MKKQWLLLIVIVALFLLVCWSLWWSNFGLKIARYRTGGNALPMGFEGFRIVQLSDLHSVSLEKERTAIKGDTSGKTGHCGNDRRYGEPL